MADTLELNEVVISGIQESKAKETSLSLESYTAKQLAAQSPYNLSDALARIPGISQMNTGNAISKPVIRGLYGNRVLVLLSGLRFDNQQFQDEHGLGLSQIGIDRVEVIKGPASILYGTDAVGGIINIIDKEPSAPGKTLDATTRLFSNTIGTLTDVGYTNAKEKNWWSVRIGAETHGDYTDGKGNRVLNSRNKGYYLKLGMGFRKEKWTQVNRYNFSYNQYGFIIDNLNQFFSPDARYTRAMNGPHHNVMLNIFSSENNFKLRSSTLMLNVGVQSNRRKEDEGGGEISLDMHLLSALENAKWEKPLNSNLLFVVNQQFTFENNTNYGKRILIPDAHLIEGNLSGFLKYHTRKIVIEAGIGYNNKDIKTFKTGTLNLGSINTPDTSIRPFQVNRSAFNSIAGISYNPTNWLNIKANAATGNRAANLAELSSNGLHEGVYRCEIGTPGLQMEQNIATDISLEIEHDYFFLSASAFYNHFKNYIYLSLSQEPAWYGFPRYRYTQQNADLYGGEAIAIVKPIPYLQWKTAFSMTEGKLSDGTYLPFIPAYKLVSSIKLSPSSKTLHSFYIEPELAYTFAQNHPAQFETATADYTLVNLNTGLTTHFHKNKVQWILAFRNLLNTYYTDHLSRLKYYGLHNEGINIILTANTSLRL